MSNLIYNLSRLDANSVIDILLVTLVFYGLLTLLHGTQAEQLVRGILILAVLAAIAASTFKPLTAFSWLIDKALPALLVAIPVVFQPELRRGLERVGRSSGKLLTPRPPYSRIEQAIEAVVRAALSLSRVKQGALMVFEHHTGLEDYIETGVRLDALTTADLLRTIFMPGTTLHDGAVVIRHDRVVAAGVILPLGQTINAPQQSLGTRHLAALGISQATDAVVVVVSEETGAISIAHNGQLTRGLDQYSLEETLRLRMSQPKAVSGWRRFLAGMVQSK